MGDSSRPRYEQLQSLELVRYTIAESLRLYPEPPILIRRTIEEVELPQVSPQAGDRRRASRRSPFSRHPRRS